MQQHTIFGGKFLQLSVRGAQKNTNIHLRRPPRVLLDEGSWQIPASEEYDAEGNLWRVSEARNISYYSEPVFWTTIEMTYDLKAERYCIDGLDDGSPAYDFSPGFRGNEFTASAARRAARR